MLDVVGVGEAMTPDELDGLGGSIGLDVSAIGTSEADLLRHNDPGVRAVGQPGGGAVGRAADLAMYYQALLANPDGAVAARRAGRRHGRDPLRPGRPDDGRTGEPHTGAAAGRRLATRQ